MKQEKLLSYSVSSYMHILVTNSVTNLTKEFIWQKITAAVNEAEGGLGNRTVDEVKKKLKDLFQGRQERL